LITQRACFPERSLQIHYGGTLHEVCADKEQVEEMRILCLRHSRRCNGKTVSGEVIRPASLVTGLQRLSIPYSLYEEAE
jgi:hypothetical protein